MRMVRFLSLVLFMIASFSASANCCSLGCCDCSCVAQISKDDAEYLAEEINAILEKKGIDGEIVEFRVMKSPHGKMKRGIAKDADTESSEAQTKCFWTCWPCSTGTCCGMVWN